MRIKSNLRKKILITGPVGSGKSFLRDYLRRVGVPAFDADYDIPGLHQWYDRAGRKVKFPKNANRKWMETHAFLWERKVLERFLSRWPKAVVLGTSDNFHEMEDLFDHVYYLYVLPRVIGERLMSPDRKNVMGNTVEQRRLQVAAAARFNRTAQRRGYKIVDAAKPPEEIWKQIDF